MRFTIDTGGTFTDLVVEDDAGLVHMYKAPTTPDDPTRGVLATFDLAAADLGFGRMELLGRGSAFIYGTTHATNAIVTGSTARTAFLTTLGHPDILVIREGGKTEPFNFSYPYPAPYVPRSLTFEVPERIGYDGAVVELLDERAARAILERIAGLDIEAIGVCLLWSIVNPAHELKLGALIRERLPGVPFTLSHQINPSLREYRRASSTCIDASLKPLMQRHIRSLEERLREAGFRGRMLMITAQGGIIGTTDMAEAPIHSVNSGPAMAPISGRHYARIDAEADTAIVADTGGTTFDVSLVRKGRVPWTRETWIGLPYRGHMTGFPSVDVRSIGAGGGSIAWVDRGGLLHVGPKSAGATPGPVCYGQGGTQPTVTDAAVVVGYIDPAYFLGGTMALDRRAATEAIRTQIADTLGFSVEEAAAAILSVMTENMVHAIEDITVNQGIDPRGAVLIGGGGGAGLNVAALARRLGCRRAIIPDVAAALSAAGALMSELHAEFRATSHTTTTAFDFKSVNRVLAALEAKCKAFIAGPGEGAAEYSIEFAAEARYPEQFWEIDVALPKSRIYTPADVERLNAIFHAAHEDVFAISDPGSPIEILTWRASVRCRLHAGTSTWSVAPATRRRTGGPVHRPAYFRGAGNLETQVIELESMPRNREIVGPAIVESPFTTIVVDPGTHVVRQESGSLVIRPEA
jgi:N-methylhydantoinase A